MVEELVIPPNRTGVCRIIIINPMPLKNPEITGYGTYFISFGAEVKEIKICKIDAITKINTTSEILPDVKANADAKIIAIGAVGPDTTGCLHPIIPTINDKIIAPQIPAEAPNPDATPKAKACGNAIIPAIIAPKVSPLTKLNFFNIFSIISP